jgi:hypothetical protein
MGHKWSLLSEVWGTKSRINPNNEAQSYLGNSNNEAQSSSFNPKSGALFRNLVGLSHQYKSQYVQKIRIMGHKVALLSMTNTETSFKKYHETLGTFVRIVRHRFFVLVRSMKHIHPKSGAQKSLQVVDNLYFLES